MPANGGNALGKFIANRLIEIDKQQRQVADELGIAESSVSEFISGARPVPLKLLDALAYALELDDPIMLYQLAGRLADFPGSEIVKLLRGVPKSEIEVITKMVRAYLQTQN